MASEQIPEEAEELWRSQPPEMPRISLDDLHRRLRKFERTIFWRNTREYLAGAIVVAGFAFYEWKFPGPLLRVGSGLTIAGALFVMFQLHRRASAKTAPDDLGRNTYVAFHRRELVRQRDALRAVWSWYLLPFVPGLMVFLAGLIQSAVNTAQMAGRALGAFQVTAFAAGCASFVIAVFVGVWFVNRWAAARLQAQIDELDASTQDLC